MLHAAVHLDWLLCRLLFWVSGKVVGVEVLWGVGGCSSTMGKHMRLLVCVFIYPGGN